MEGDIDTPNDETIEIGIVLFPGVQMAAVLGMTDFFTSTARGGASRAAGTRLRITHWRIDKTGRPGRIFDTHAKEEGKPTVLLLPPALGDPVPSSVAEGFVDWLRDSHGNGTVLGSICAGAFLLGETGLLDGRRATTHWVYGEAFHDRFPHVRLDIDQLLIDEGDIISAGGVMAWTDLCLRLIDRFLGPSVMAETARLFLVDPPGREQRYYSAFTPRLDHRDAAVLKLQYWLRETEARDVRLSRLAKESGLEERTLLRRFKRATGLTTIDYCQRLRVAKAQDMLRTSGTPFDQIAWDVGYTDAASFRRLFARIVGLAPGAYRARFRGTAKI